MAIFFGFFSVASGNDDVIWKNFRMRNDDGVGGTEIENSIS